MSQLVLSAQLCSSVLHMEFCVRRRGKEPRVCQSEGKDPFRCVHKAAAVMVSASFWASSLVLLLIIGFSCFFLGR